MNIGFSKDKVYKKVERNMDNKSKVTGTTIIQHTIRISLGLTLREYVLLDFIFQWHESNKAPITFADYFIGTGIYPQFIGRMFGKLKEKELLFKDTDGKVKTTKKWNDNFDRSSQFEELWKLMNTGTKSKAREAFKKAVKVDSFDNIKAGLIVYKNYKEEANSFPAHLSSFLNPKLKIWQETPNADPYKKKMTQPQFFPTPQTTGPKSKL